jgi:hypothetical protein
MSDDEIGAILDAQIEWDTWQPNTAYSYGDVVRPTVGNGHLYQCIVAGTSSDVEPTWPLYTAPDNKVAVTRPHWHGFYGPYPGSQVTDSDTLIWIEAGFDVRAQYNVKRATYEAWQQKAAKASADYDVVVDKDKMDRSQVMANCLVMAERYRPIGGFA